MMASKLQAWALACAPFLSRIAIRTNSNGNSAFPDFCGKAIQAYAETQFLTGSLANGGLVFADSVRHIYQRNNPGAVLTLAGKDYPEFGNTQLGMRGGVLERDPI